MITTPRTMTCLAAGLLLALVASTRIATAAPPTDEQLIESIGRMVDAALSRPGAVGLSVAVARNGEIIMAEGYGLAEVEHGVKADANTPPPERVR